MKKFEEKFLLEKKKINIGKPCLGRFNTQNEEQNHLLLRKCVYNTWCVYIYLIEVGTQKAVLVYLNVGSDFRLFGYAHDMTK